MADTTGNGAGNGHGPSPADPPPPSKPRRPKRRKGVANVNLRHEMFLDAYLGGPDGVRGSVEAAMRSAGYRAFGGDTKQALLNNPYVKRQIERYLDRTNLRVEKALQALSAMVFSEVTDAVSWDASGRVRVIPSKRLDPLTRMSIQEFSKVPGQNGPVLKIKMHDKGPLLKLLFQYLKLIEPPTVNVRVFIQQFIQKASLGRLTADEADQLELLLAKIAPPVKALSEGETFDATILNGDGDGRDPAPA